MKKFKIIDVWVSIGLIAGFTIFSLIKLDYAFLIGYGVVGGWQIISMMVHHFLNWFNDKGSSRYNYHWAVLIIVLISMSGMVFNPLLFILVPLLFAAPLMAVYYTWLCYNEVYVKMQRPLAFLK